MGKLRRIAIDSGKNTTKVCVEQGGNSHTCIKFKTAYTIGKKPTEDKNTHVLKVDGETYLVGEQGATFSDKTNSKNNNVHKIASLCAIALVCNHNDKVSVAVGCPLEQFYDIDERRKYQKEILPLGPNSIEIDGIKKVIDIQEVKVLPESFGAVATNESIFSNNIVNVIDIGGLNVNACTYEDAVLNENSIRTLTYGGLYLCRKTLDKMKDCMSTEERKKYERTKPSEMQFEVSRKQDTNGKYIPQFRQARLEVVDDIYDTLFEMGYNFDRTTVFIGGTSNLLKDEIEAKFGEQAVFLGNTLDDLQYVNAEGFYRYIKE